MALLPLLLATLSGHPGIVIVSLSLVATAIFVAGFAWKVAGWMRAPVAFRIPLTVGQQASLPGLPRRRFDNPQSRGEALIRAALDVLGFRPLTRATPSATATSPGLAHGRGRALWMGAAALHLALAIVLLRHLRLFLDPVPGFVAWLERHDRATEMLLPALHITSLVLLLALGFLLMRRLVLPRLRYLSLAADYVPLLLIVGIVGSGLVMRHITRTDVTWVKQAAIALAQGQSTVAMHLDGWLVVHLALVAGLLAYFPLSKLMHAPGALMSPTLGMANDSRVRRHVNVRNPSVATLHYADYEDSFRDRMIEAGLPVERS
jgi:nitrate reductase gamma subunit